MVDHRSIGVMVGPFRHGGTMSFVSISKTIPIPLSEQLVRAIINAIRVESLTEGQRLPAVRQMANDLGVATNTVVRAYRILERDGWITTSKRRGSFVASPLPAGGDRDGGIREAIEMFLAKAEALGYSSEAAANAVQTHVDHSLRSRQEK